MWYIVLYFILIVFIIILLYRRGWVRSGEEYFVYGRKGGIFEITMSLVALVFGASSVLGLAGWAYRIGLNAIWWTLSGCIFLLILVFIVKFVYLFKGFSIVDIIEVNFGDLVRGVASIVLFIAWVGVLSGQIIAGANITSLLLGDRFLSFIVFSGLFLVYTLIWGQVGALKSSFLQVFLMVLGLILIFIGIYRYLGGEVRSVSFGFGFDDNFTFSIWLTVFLSVGFSYLFGPDIYSRIFSSRNYDVARKSLILASVIIILISLLIVLIGILGREVLKVVDNPDNLIPLLAIKFVPEELKPLVLIALISIPLSGADVILITSTTILSKNVLPFVFGKKDIFEKIWFIRFLVVVVILLSTSIAIRGGEIIPMLLTSYKVFSSTIAPLILVSILSRIFNYEIKFSKLREMFILVVLVLSAGIIILVEMKFLPFYVQNYNVYMLLFNSIIFIIVSFVCVK